jgi:vitamin B12 transporter
MTFVKFQARCAVLSLVIAAYCGGGAGAAYAQEAQSKETHSIEFEDIVVTATRVAIPVAKVIADVTVIDRSTLDLAGQSSLRDVLGQQPGIQWTSNGSYRSTTGLFLRGASSSQTLFLVDGVRIGSATSGSASIENIPLDRIERIEILRGAASALYGPDAVGGVVQIFTREAADGFALSASVGAGTDGQAQGAAGLSGRAGMWGYSVGISHEKADGINVSSNPASSGFNVDADNFSTTSLNAKLSAKLAREHLLILSALKSKTTYRFDSTPFPNPLNLTKATSDAQAKPDLEAVNLRWEAQWLPQWTSTLVLGNAKDESISDYYRMSDAAWAGSSKFNTTRSQLTWQNDVKIGMDVVTALLETRKESVDSSTAYTVSERNFDSVMASYALNRPDWSGLVVVRNDQNSQFGGYTNWALSGGYALLPGLRAVASTGTSFQAPSFNQLYFPGFGNPALTPQINRANELGLKYNAADVAWSALVYRNAVQGFITPATNVQSSLALLRGATLSAEVRRGDTRYAVSYDYADPRSYSSTLANNDLPLVRVAQNVWQARVSHALRLVSLFGEIKVSSTREDAKVVGTGRETLAAYATLNLGTQWKLGKELSLLARLNNATDAQYALVNGYTMPGRNLFVSLAWAQ